MTFLNRAILYLKRKKSRSILLIFIIFVMSSFVMSGLALKAGAVSETENVQKTLGSSFKLIINSQDPNNIELVTTDTYSYETYAGEYISKNMIADITSIDGITDYMINSDQIVWTDLELQPGLFTDSYNNYTSAYTYASKESFFVQMHGTMILPCNTSDLHENFRTGAFSITEGNGITENSDSVAVISDRLAKRNNLKLGDTFTIEIKEGLYEPGDTPSKTWGEPAELKIIGLFSINFEQEPSVYTPENGYAENLIFTDWETGLKMKSIQSKGPVPDKYGEVTFFVSDPSNMNKILEQVKSLDRFDSKYFSAVLDDTAYRATAKSLSLMNMFATLLIIAGIAGCMAILTLVLNMWTKGRKQEIGILLSIGTSKKEIILQLGLECITATLAALILTIALSGTLTGTLCSFAEKIAFPDTKTNEYTIETETGNLTPTISKNSTVAVHMDYTVSVSEIIIIIITTCFISIGSVTISVIQVIKLNPKSLLQSL